MKTRVLWIAAVLVAAGCGSSDEGGSSRDSSSSGRGGAAAVPLAGTTGTATAGAQLARCSSDDDCTGGLECYTFGRYCSRSCATNTDCGSIGGITYTCYVPPTFGMGMMQPGGGGAGGSGTGTTGGARGTCRIECTGASDTSCPQGLMCIDVGGGGMMGPTYRCAYPETGGGGMAGTSGGGSSGRTGGSSGRSGGSSGTGSTAGTSGGSSGSGAGAGGAGGM
jgi:hypothetical protein